MHSSIVCQVDNNLALLFASASAAPNNGNDQPLVSKRTNAGIILVFRLLYQAQGVQPGSELDRNLNRAGSTATPDQAVSKGSRTEYSVADMLSRSSNRYSAVALPGVVVGLTGAVLPRLLEPRCQEICNGPPLAGHGRRLWTCTV